MRKHDASQSIDKIVELDRSLLLDLDEIDDDTSAVKRYISYNIDFFTLESILKNQIECRVNPLVSFVSLDNQCISPFTMTEVAT